MLDQAVEQEVLDRFDHTYLNLEGYKLFKSVIRWKIRLPKNKTNRSIKPGRPK